MPRIADNHNAARVIDIEGVTILADAGGHLLEVILPADPPCGFNGASLAGVGARLESFSIDWGRFTSFQRGVLAAMRRIPRGATWSYARLASEAGHPRAVRAAASACARNPVPLFLPCHRVIGSDGSPGGFSAGLAWKLLLLDIEGVHLTPKKTPPSSQWPTTRSGGTPQP